MPQKIWIATEFDDSVSELIQNRFNGSSNDFALDKLAKP